MSFTITPNYSEYVSLLLESGDTVMNKFFRAIPVGLGNGSTVTVNIWNTGTVATPSCSSLLSNGQANTHVALTAYERVSPLCVNAGDLRSLEMSPASQRGLLQRFYRDLVDAAKGIFVDDMVTQYKTNFTNTFTLLAGGTNDNFGLASAAGAQNSLATLGAAVANVKAQCGDPSSMAIIFPVNRTVDNLTNLAGQISAFMTNPAGFMAQDGYLTFMGIPCYSVASTDAGWGGTTIAHTGDTQIAAIVLSKITPGYAIAPVGQNGNVTSGDFSDALVIKGPEYDNSTGTYRINAHLSFGAGIANETAIAVVENAT